MEHSIVFNGFIKKFRLLLGIAILILLGFDILDSFLQLGSFDFLDLIYGDYTTFILLLFTFIIIFLSLINKIPHTMVILIPLLLISIITFNIRIRFIRDADLQYLLFMFFPIFFWFSVYFMRSIKHIIIISGLMILLMIPLIISESIYYSSLFKNSDYLIINVLLYVFVTINIYQINQPNPMNTQNIRPITRIDLSLFEKVNIMNRVLVSLITFGIYAIFWLYDIVKAMNALSYRKRSALQDTVLILLIPFYGPYWGFKTGLSLQYFSRKHRLNSNKNSLIYAMLFYIDIIPFITLMLLQKNINQIKRDQHILIARYQSESITKEEKPHIKSTTQPQKQKTKLVKSNDVKPDDPVSKDNANLTSFDKTFKSNKKEPTAPSMTQEHNKQAVPADLNTEDQLLKLKNMYDQQLISKEEYQIYKKRVLDALFN